MEELDRRTGSWVCPSPRPASSVPWLASGQAQPTGNGDGSLENKRLREARGLLTLSAAEGIFQQWLCLPYGSSSALLSQLLPGSLLSWFQIHQMALLLLLLW